MNGLGGAPPVFTSPPQPDEPESPSTFHYISVEQLKGTAGKFQGKAGVDDIAKMIGKHIRGFDVHEALYQAKTQAPQHPEFRQMFDSMPWPVRNAYITYEKLRPKLEEISKKPPEERKLTYKELAALLGGTTRMVSQYFNIYEGLETPFGIIITSRKHGTVAPKEDTGLKISELPNGAVLLPEKATLQKLADHIRLLIEKRKYAVEPKPSLNDIAEDLYREVNGRAHKVHTEGIKGLIWRMDSQTRNELKDKVRGL